MLKQSVAIGVVLNNHQQVLVSKRNKNQHLSGYWEFPGGKVNQGESFKSALRRELTEELGIEASSIAKLFEFDYQYQDRHIHFQAYKVLSYLGVPQSKENQQIRWMNLQDLKTIKFPDANKSLLDAIILPKFYMIADEGVLGKSLIANVERQLKLGVKIIQHRTERKIRKTLYLENALQLKQLCEEFGANYIMNAPLEWAQDVNPHGIHLSSYELHKASNDKVFNPDYELFSASCHNEEEINLANHLGVRSLLVGSVCKTKSHPNKEALGWKRFTQLCSYANIPVYALGGLCLDDYKNVLVCGGQGVAAIRAFIN